MNRRGAGATDRHALLKAHAYPSSSSSATVLSPAASAYSTPTRTASPYENPYGRAGGDHVIGMGHIGAPKKEPAPAAPFSNLFSGNSLQQRTAADLEDQNDARLDGLSERIKVLKDISTGIGNEARASTAEMDSLNDVFANTTAFLGNTFTKMNHMARRQRGWFCNMMLFLILVIWIFLL
ncbi:protein transport protein bet1 [Malassezia sp. CBS 17886]|nr:protein transport protein bet1 [Malassezia sp. CBS 17886]